MEGGDGGRQQVVVMHRATFLATRSNKGLRATSVMPRMKRGLGGLTKAYVNLGTQTLTSQQYCTCLPLCMSLH